MNQRLLLFLALVFVSLVILQAATGAVVFGQLVGLTPDTVLKYYADKSLHGLLEVTLPHTLFIAIALMASLHFLAFIQAIPLKEKQRMIYLLFVLFAFDQSSPILIAQGFSLFAYVKIGAFFGFEIALCWMWMMIFRSIFIRQYRD
ncbi:hypothetical protein [Sulfuricurvum sp.]|uniref:hypothetical protein n=1 Tax=Sulfuricurvum sp. TaxID=2025608 RepID=UPI003BAF76FD